MLVAIGGAGGKIALAAADISTGRFEALCVEEHSLHAELARLRASEIVLAEDLVLDVAEAHPFERAAFDSSRAETQLKKLFGVATLDGFGQFSRAELAAMGGLIAYLDHSGKGRLPLLQPTVQRHAGMHLMIDAATRESLEITKTMAGRSEERRVGNEGVSTCRIGW